MFLDCWDWSLTLKTYGGDSTASNFLSSYEGKTLNQLDWIEYSLYNNNNNNNNDNDNNNNNNDDKNNNKNNN